MEGMHTTLWQAVGFAPPSRFRHKAVYITVQILDQLSSMMSLAFSATLGSSLLPSLACVHPWEHVQQVTLGVAMVILRIKSPGGLQAGSGPFEATINVFVPHQQQISYRCATLADPSCGMIHASKVLF